MNDKGSRTILLVEDNPDDVNLTMRALRSNNIMNKVTVISDGEEALNYLFGDGSNEDTVPNDIPDIILMDLKLPKVDGFEVLKRIRSEESTKFLPVIVLTSSMEERDLIESYSLGANSYIRKPVDFIQFSGIVKNLGYYWLQLNEVPKGGGYL